MRRRPSFAILAVALATAVGVPAFAAWLVSSDTSSTSVSARSLANLSPSASPLSSSSINVAWVPTPANPPGTVYTVQRTAPSAVTVCADTTVTACADSGLSANTDYTYQVVSRISGSNWMKTSPTVTGRTTVAAAALDLTAPTGTVTTARPTVIGTTTDTATVTLVVKNAGGTTLQTHAVTPTGSTSPYSISKQLDTLVVGSYTVTGTQTNPGGTATDSVAFTVQLDSAAPVITAVGVGPQTSSGPTGRIGTSKPAYIYATVTDAGGVASVTGSVAAVGTGSTATPVTMTLESGSLYRGSFTSGAVTAISYTVTVTATDTAGNPAGPVSGSVTGDTTLPTAIITQPVAQADPTNTASPIVFTITTSEAITGLTGSDVVVAGTAPGTKSVAITGAASPYTATVTGATGEGTVTVTLPSGTFEDTAGNANTAAATVTDGSVTVDSTVPTVTTVSLTNGGNAAALGRVEGGDSVTITFSEAMDASKICSTWSGIAGSLTANGDVTVTITDNGSNDVMTVASAACPSLKVGSVSLGGNYVTATSTFKGNGGSASEVALVAPVAPATTSTLRIRVGGLATGTANGTANNAAVPSYTPPTGLTDRAGNTLDTAAVNGTSSRF